MNGLFYPLSFVLGFHRCPPSFVFFFHNVPVKRGLSVARVELLKVFFFLFAPMLGPYRRMLPLVCCVEFAVFHRVTHL